MARQRQPTEWELKMGHRLAELRRRAGLTQEGLARASGVGTDAIRKYERGRRTPLFDQAIKLAQAMGVSLDELAGIEPPARGIAPVGVNEASPMPPEERLEKAKAALQGGRKKGGK
jgi:transcriptional regulator with XRE-family HTH domain